MSPGLLRVALEHPVQAFRLPPECHGQGFERARATATLDGVPLDFPHDGRGHVRALRKLTLTPAELADTVADSPGNRSPVLRIAFRHAFLRAPLPAPRLAGHFTIPHQAETNRKHTKALRNISELKSASNRLFHLQARAAIPGLTEQDPLTAKAIGLLKHFRVSQQRKHLAPRAVLSGLHRGCTLSALHLHNPRTNCTENASELHWHCMANKHGVQVELRTGNPGCGAGARAGPGTGPVRSAGRTRRAGRSRGLSRNTGSACLRSCRSVSGSGDSPSAAPG